MDVTAIWIGVLSVATPVAGIVGFGIQLRQVKKTRLENEKLQLEISALRDKAAESEQRILRVTTDEVVHFAYPKTRLKWRDSAFESRSPMEYRDVNSACALATTSRRERLAIAGALAVFVLLVAYFLYDIYRMLIWLDSNI